MIDALVLFCGGPAIYDLSPKPLQKLRSGETLIERYLNHLKPQAPPRIILLVEQSFKDEFDSIITSLDHCSDISTIACQDRSSTFAKLQAFVGADGFEDLTVMFSYPDIFVIGELDISNLTDEHLLDSAFISFTPICSRFPRLVVDAYGDKILGISNHSSTLPANPLHVFGGHLVLRVGLLKKLVADFLSDISIDNPSLEFDMFFWLINSSSMCSLPIYGRWIQVDSPRDVEALLILT